MERIKVVIKEPGKYAHMAEIGNNLESLQEIVGGYIETVTICTDLVLICNEDGRLLGLPYNCNYCGADFVGTIILAGVDGDEFTDVPIEDLQVVGL